MMSILYIANIYGIYLTKSSTCSIILLVVVLQILVRTATEGAHAWAPFYLCKGESMSKPFLTYNEQIHKLEHEKELIITDREFACKQLQKTGYFALIGGYKHIFKNPASKKYTYGVTFEEIVTLYQFDEALRALFLKHILHIEREMKSLLSYYFCETFGESQDAYLDANNYNYTRKTRFHVDKMIRILQDMAIKKSNYAYINHTRNTYGNIPLWVLINALTFGTISKMYQFSKYNIQSKICKNFPHINEKQLHQILTIVAKCRNVCAHNERLFSHKTTDAIPDLMLHEKLSIDKRNNNYISGKKDLFAVVIAFRYLLERDDFLQFKTQLSKQIHQLLRNCPHINQELLLDRMGFPENWESITRYRNLSR